MLTKYLSLMPLVVRASAAILSPIDKVSEEHQKDFQMDSPISGGYPHVNGSLYKRSKLAKRNEEFFTLPLIYRDYNYYTELYMGTPETKIEAYVDMGESDTWVIPQKEVCKTATKRVVPLKPDIPEHNAEDSQSLLVKKNSGASKANESETGISSYLDSRKRELMKCNSIGIPLTSATLWLLAKSSFPFRYYKGQWGYDNVRISSTRVKMIFAVHNLNIDKEPGVLGLGRPDGSERWLNYGDPYLSFPVALKKAGIIKKMSYSLFLHGGGPANGSILFGAVDHAKHFGNLQTVPMVNLHRYGYLIELAVALNKIYLEGSNQKVDILKESIGARFEFGTDYESMPATVYSNLIESLSAESWPSHPFYKVNCSYMYGTGKIVYDFSGNEIKVPISHLIRKISTGICYLAVEPYDDDEKLPHAILRSSFLRNVYLNIDLESKEVSMAQASFTNKEFVEAIDTSVPRAVKAERYSDTRVVRTIDPTYHPVKFKM